MKKRGFVFVFLILINLGFVLAACSNNDQIIMRLEDPPSVTVPVSTSLPSGTVVVYHFDESAGATTFVDSSGNGYDASCSGGTCPTKATGQVGGAFQFDGSNDRVIVPHNADLDEKLKDKITISAWVKPAQNKNYNVIVCKGVSGASRVCSFTRSDGKFWAGVDGYLNVGPSSTPVIENQWTHVVAVFDGSTWKYYINGIFSGQYNEGDGKYGGSTGDLTIGQQGYVQSGENNDLYYFKGMIDEVVIWDRDLNQTEIQQVYVYQGLQLPSGLKIYLPFDEASGDIYTDASGNNYEGECSGSSCPTRIAGEKGGALNFDDNDVAIIPGSASLPKGPSTYAAWIYVPSTVSHPQYEAVVSRGSESSPGTSGNSWWVIHVRNYGSNWGYHHTLSGCEFIDTIPKDTWVHVATVWDGTNVNLYRDGQLRGSQNKQSCFAIGNADFSLGGPTYYYHGKMDEFMFWDRALNETEIAQVKAYGEGNGGGSGTVTVRGAMKDLHGALWDQTSFPNTVCFEDIFGYQYSGTNVHTCDGNNNLIGLSANTNAIGQPSGGSSVDVCYGNLNCTITNQACDPSLRQKEVVGLSSNVNALFSNPSMGYGYRICCTNETLVAPFQALVLDVESPANQSYENRTDFKVRGNKNMTWCGFSLDGKVTINMTRFNETYYYLTNDTMSNGSHSVVFSCNDTGNIFAASSLIWFTNNVTPAFSAPILYGLCLNEGTTWSDAGTEYDSFNSHNSEYCMHTSPPCCPTGYSCIFPEEGSCDHTGTNEGCGCQLVLEWCSQVLSCSNYGTEAECVANSCGVIGRERTEHNCNYVGSEFNISCDNNCNWNGTTCGFNSYYNYFPSSGPAVVNPQYKCVSSSQLGECLNHIRSIGIRKSLIRINGIGAESAVDDTVFATLDDSIKTWCPRYITRDYACGFEVELGFFGFWNFVSSLGLIFGVYLFINRKG